MQTTRLIENHAFFARFRSAICQFAHSQAQTNRLCYIGGNLGYLHVFYKMFFFFNLRIHANIRSMKSYSIFLFLCVLFISSCGILGTKPVETHPPIPAVDPLETLHTEIEDILKDMLFSTASIGIKVVAVETGEVIYAKNAQKLHHPASTTKLFTAAPALAKLGSDFRFTTTLYTDAEKDAQAVNNIYLKGSGDPILKTEDVVNLAVKVVESGILSIDGGIIVDESYFDTVREGPGWMWDDRPYWISALSIRSLEPSTGSRAIACGQFLKKTLEEKGVKVSGQVITGAVPSDFRILATHASPPLADIVKLMNKPSDNWIAEMLFKTLGAEVKGEPGSWQKGREAISEYLGEILGQPSAHRFVDGSGLSRYNLVSAELLTQLLVRLYHNFELMPEFTSSLPIAGVDGTLRNRMRGMYAAKTLRAKTGTLSGVSALAGYTRTADGEVFAFGILISHYVGSAVPARGVQDRIGNLLTEFSRQRARKH